MFSTLLSSVLLFFVQALALKLSVGMMATSKTQDNSYTQALRLSAGFIVLSFLLGLIAIKIIAWPIYVAVWCVVIMKTYRLSFMRSIGVALGQSALTWLLGWIVSKMFGLQLLGMSCA